MIAAIILAAGGSERMGQPKAALTLRGTTFLGAILGACQAAGVNRRVVVVGAGFDNLFSENDLRGATVLLNPAVESGPIGSIRIAVQHLVNHPVEAVVVWHVDRPHIAIATLESLLDRFRDGESAIVLPAYRGRRGHPVVFARAVFDELLTAPNDEGARAVVRADPSRVAVVHVDDPAVVEDIDTPEAYQALLKRVEEAGATPPPPPPRS
jgi:molybdenum cofactor cytidylyltransferase